MQEVRILVADDHPIFRRGLKEIIEAEAGLRIIAEADDGRAALARVQELRPQLALLDIDMPELNGFEVARQILEQRLPVEIIFLTMHSEEAMFNRALSLGVKGYLVKSSAATGIVNAIRAVLAGENYTSPSVTSYLFKRARRAAAPLTGGLAALTPTERHVLKLIAEYKTSKEIAAELGVHYRTVENYRTNICAKLELRGSHSLIKFALQHQEEL
jgi:DNA-binding NarL/FixJ family response regulator